VVNSHWHRDHSGGNQALANDGSVIVAHENVRKRMSVDGFVAVFPASFVTSEHVVEEAYRALTSRP
jgi:glyoxylase-like metal-dependent hydrolase (beta-lactamase superfamily II)